MGGGHSRSFDGPDSKVRLGEPPVWRVERCRLCILAPLGKEQQRDALVAKAAGLGQQHALAGSFRQRFAKGGDGLCEPRPPALALSEVP